MIFFQLFFTFAKIGLFAFGGGYASLPLIEKEIVNATHWLTHAEFLEVVAISQLTPGPIAINAATLVGYKVGGLGGSALATIGFCLPPIILVLIAVRFLKKFEDNVIVGRILTGVRPAVIALIAAATYSVVAGGGITDLKGIIIAVISFLVVMSRKVDPVIVLVLAGISGMILFR